MEEEVLTAIAGLGLTLLMALVALLAQMAGLKLSFMPKPTGCPQCNAGLTDHVSFAGRIVGTEGPRELKVRRRLVFPTIVVVVSWLFGFALLGFGLLVFVALAVGGGIVTLRDSVLAGLAIPLGILVVAWSLRYIQSVPVIECLVCGWKAPKRAWLR